MASIIPSLRVHPRLITKLIILLVKGDPVLDCSRWVEIDIPVTGTTEITFIDHIDITQYTSDFVLTYIVYPETSQFTKYDIGSELVGMLYVVNTSGKTSKCQVFFKLKGMCSRDSIIRTMPINTNQCRLKFCH